jgi:branched-chain amino acid transport system permease protein
MLVICLLGGFYNFGGPIVGSAVYIFLSKIISKETMFWMFFLGVIIVFLVLFMRNGIVGFLSEKLAPALHGTSRPSSDEEAQ